MGENFADAMGMVDSYLNFGTSGLNRHFGCVWQVAVYTIYRGNFVLVGAGLFPVLFPKVWAEGPV